MDDGRELPPRHLVIWTFGNAEYDASCRELRVGGRLRQIEGKSLVLLEVLLNRRGEVATQDELKAAVWPEVKVDDGSVPTAVNKLRKALNDEKRALILSVRNVGYRIGVVVKERLVEAAADAPVVLKSGEKVPSRPQWRLERALVSGHNPSVWLAKHDATNEARFLSSRSLPLASRD